MAAAVTEQREPDQLEGVAFPEARTAVVGHREALASIFAALDADRVPGGILLHGPRGIGKATLAFHVARTLFARTGDESPDHIAAIAKYVDGIAPRAIPVIEDAAHSLGTLWKGHNIGTIGKVGCFSFQSYKLVNAGEGGILVTDDPEIAARCVIMSGAYEHNWKKHAGLQNSFMHWQNRLPLYNMRMQNLSAAVIRPQLPLVWDRVAGGRANHDYVADRLNRSDWLEVPPALPQEQRAPDSLQFRLLGRWSDAEARAFQDAAKARGITVQIFGLSEDNARAFWNWKFIGDLPDLPKTRAMLMRTGDLRLPARLKRHDLDFIADAILGAVGAVKSARPDAA